MKTDTHSLSILPTLGRVVTPPSHYEVIGFCSRNAQILHAWFLSWSAQRLRPYASAMSLGANSAVQSDLARFSFVPLSDAWRLCLVYM